MVLKKLPRFSDIVLAISVSKDFHLLYDMPKIYLDLYVDSEFYCDTLIWKIDFELLTFYKNIFFCRGFEEMELLHYEYHDRDPVDMIEQTMALLELYRKVLRYPMYKAATYVLLWRLFSIVPIHERFRIEDDVKNYFDLIDDVMRPFVKVHVDGKANTTRYKQFKEDLAFHSNRLKFVFVRLFIQAKT